MGIYNEVDGAEWVMTGSQGFPLCANDVASIVAHHLGLKNHPARH